MRTHTFSYPPPLPEDEYCECDRCGGDTLISETEDVAGKSVCWDCQAEITDPSLPLN